MRDTLVETGPEAERLSIGAARELNELRESYADVLDGDPMEDTAEGVTWHTFAGGAVNRLLAAGLKQITGHKWISGNLSVWAKGVGMPEARMPVGELRGLN